MATRHLLVLIALSVLQIHHAATTKELKIGFVGPLVASHGYPVVDLETHGPAVSLAVEDAQQNGLLADFNISVVWRDDYCKGKQGMAAAIELQWDEQVDMIAGSFCSPVVVPVGHYWSYWNTPVFTHGATDGVLADKDTYNTLVRVGPIYNRYGGAFVEIFKKFGWTRTVILAKPTRTCDYGATSINDEFSQNDLTVAEWMKQSDDEEVTDEQIDSYLNRFRQKARVIILCLNRPLIKRLLVRAWRNGMTQNGEYVFFTYNMIPYETTFFPWEDTSQDDFEEIKLAYRSFKQLTMAPLEGPDVDDFRQAVEDRLAYPPWDSLTSAGTGSLYSLMLYDAVTLYLQLVDETITEGGDYRDGDLLAKKAQGRSLQGKSGLVLLDDKSDRILDFRLWHLAPGAEEFTSWTEVRMTSPPGERMDETIVSYWYTDGNVIPSDIPSCGDQCQPDDDDDDDDDDDSDDDSDGDDD